MVSRNVTLTFDTSQITASSSHHSLTLPPALEPAQLYIFRFSMYQQQQE
jgi:hypothetical protein